MEYTRVLIWVRTAVLPLTALWLLSSCALVEITNTRDVQEIFDQASQMHNSMKLDQASDSRDSLYRTEQLYQQVINRVNSMADKEEQLRDDGLWGNLLTLKALSHWQLKEYDSAIEVAQSIKDSDLLPRDKVMIQALPQLVRNNEAFDIQVKIPKGDYTKPLAVAAWVKTNQMFKNASVELDKIANGLDEKNSMRFYLFTSLLVTAENWKNNFDLLSKDGDCTDLDNSNVHKAACEKSFDQAEMMRIEAFSNALVMLRLQGNRCDSIRQNDFYTTWKDVAGVEGKPFKNICP